MHGMHAVGKIMATGDDAQNSAWRPSDMSVLIVDDDSIVRMDLREMLEAIGYLVVGEARDGEEAVALARKLRPDLVIMDVRLLGSMDGIHTAQALADDHSSAVLLLSGFSESNLAQRAAEAGATGYLLKPFHEGMLRPAVEFALARSAQIRRLHEEVAELREEPDTRELVEHAKNTLTGQHGMTEHEGMDRIRKASVESGKPLRAVAEAIILSQQLKAHQGRGVD